MVFCIDTFVEQSGDFNIIMGNELDIAVFAGGCFWCTEAVFLELEGVVEVIPGYTGGIIKNPAYREVTTGRTGHAESIKISFDSAIISYKTLLEVFFTTHDPTTLNQQGADRGTHYRSAVFYENEVQKNEALEVINDFEDKNIYENPIVTEITKLEEFYIAEEYHKDYYNQNSEQGYCQFVINPKLNKLRAAFADKLKTKK